MLASLIGVVQKKYSDYIIVSVHGVGYKVLCHEQAMSQLTIGEIYFFYIETIIGDDFIKLYGFLTEAEKNWFLLLSSVQGVGGKVALAILNVARPEVISDSILLGDKSIINKANGVGAKLADRIINELKHKKDLPACYDTDDNVLFEKSDKSSTGSITIPSKMTLEKPDTSHHNRQQIIEKRKIVDDAISALVNLGYQRADALKSIHQVQNDDTMISEHSLITAALKYIAKLKEDVS